MINLDEKNLLEKNQTKQIKKPKKPPTPKQTDGRDKNHFC